MSDAKRVTRVFEIVTMLRSREKASSTNPHGLQVQRLRGPAALYDPQTVVTETERAAPHHEKRSIKCRLQGPKPPRCCREF